MSVVGTERLLLAHQSGAVLGNGHRRAAQIQQDAAAVHQRLDRVRVGVAEHLFVDPEAPAELLEGCRVLALGAEHQPDAVVRPCGVGVVGTERGKPDRQPATARFERGRVVAEQVEHVGDVVVRPEAPNWTQRRVSSTKSGSEQAWALSRTYPTACVAWDIAEM